MTKKMREGLSTLVLAALLGLVGVALSATAEDGEAINTVGGALIAAGFIMLLIGLVRIGLALVRDGDRTSDSA